MSLNINNTSSVFTAEISRRPLPRTQSYDVTGTASAILSFTAVKTSVLTFCKLSPNAVKCSM